MSFTFILIVAILALGLLYVVVPVVAEAYMRYRGKSVVICPETRAPAGVEVNAGRAALSALVGGPTLRLADCTRWPEREDCGQECLAQIERAPDECLVRTQLTRWFAGKACALCRKPFGVISWTEHKPALMGEDHITIAWNDLRADKLYEDLASRKPVCWDCHVAETFRREHPELVVDRGTRAAS